MRFYTCPACNQLYVKLIDKNNDMKCCEIPLKNLAFNRNMKKDNEHYPVIRKIGNFLTIEVNENHPMVDAHHISVIFLETTQGFQFKNITHDSPQAEFILGMEEKIKNIHLYCNIHFIWSVY